MPQTDLEGAMQLGETWRAGRRERPPGTRGRPVTISVGISMYGSEHPEGHEAVLIAADQAMYQAKEEGAIGPCCSATPMSRSATPRRVQTTTARIRDAITQDRLSLHSQPIHSLASGGVERHELLLRMTADDGELLPAASLHPGRRAPGIVQELDRWVVARALSSRAARARGKPRLPATSTSPASRWPISRSSSSSSVSSTRATPTRAAAPRDHRERPDGRHSPRAGGFADRLTEFGWPGRDRRLRRRAGALLLPQGHCPST